LNSRPPVPQTGALTGLRYAPSQASNYNPGLRGSQEHHTYARNIDTFSIVARRV